MLIFAFFIPRFSQISTSFTKLTTLVELFLLMIIFMDEPAVFWSVFTSIFPVVSAFPSSVLVLPLPVLHELILLLKFLITVNRWELAFHFPLLLTPFFMTVGALFTAEQALVFLEVSTYTFLLECFLALCLISSDLWLNFSLQLKHFTSLFLESLLSTSSSSRFSSPCSLTLLIHCPHDQFHDHQ